MRSLCRPSDSSAAAAQSVTSCRARRPTLFTEESLINRFDSKRCFAGVVLLMASFAGTRLYASKEQVSHGKVVFNIKDFGATGNKSGDALPAIQKAIEAGATLYASEKPSDFAVQKVKSKDALLFGEDLEDISIGGRGTIEGQQKYFWAPDTIERSFSHKVLVETLGKSQMRSYPAGFPK